MPGFSNCRRCFYLSPENVHCWLWRSNGNQFTKGKCHLKKRHLSTSTHKYGVLERMPANNTFSNDSLQPIAVVYGWLLAKSRHLEKFGQFYNNHGADVVTVKPNVTEVLRPKKAEELAGRLLDIVQSPSNRERPVLIHGFSVGGYLYGQTLNHIVTNPKYSSVQDRIIGQIFDSPVDFNNIPYGISNAATDNAILKNTMRLSIQSYFKLTQKYTMDKFVARSKLFLSNPVRAPALVLFSNDDPVALPEACERCVTGWRDLGMDVTSKKWDSSPHVSHFYKHQEEYMELLMEFLKKVGVVQSSRTTCKNALVDD